MREETIPYLLKECAVVRAILQWPECISETVMGNGRVANLLFLPPVQLSVAIQTSEDELEECAGKVLADPSKNTLGVMLVDFFRDDQFVQEFSDLIFRQVLFFDSTRRARK